MQRSQPDGTSPLPETAELGGEGGSFGDSTSRESRRTEGKGPAKVDERLTDIAGNATRLPDVEPDDRPPAGTEFKKQPTEP
jgi:hypothetical protein